MVTVWTHRLHTCGVKQAQPQQRMQLVRHGCPHSAELQCSKQMHTRIQAVTDKTWSIRMCPVSRALGSEPDGGRHHTGGLGDHISSATIIFNPQRHHWVLDHQTAPCGLASPSWVVARMGSSLLPLEEGWSRQSRMRMQVWRDHTSPATIPNMLFHGTRKPTELSELAQPQQRVHMVSNSGGFTLPPAHNRETRGCKWRSTSVH